MKVLRTHYAPYTRELDPAADEELLHSYDVIESRHWALATTLPDVLYAPQLFKPFQHYVIQQNSLPFLLFCLDVEVSVFARGD